MFVVMQWCSQYCVADCGFLYLFLTIFIRWRMHISSCHWVLSSYIYWLRIFIVSCVDLHCCDVFDQSMNHPANQALSQLISFSLFSLWFTSFESFHFSLLSSPFFSIVHPSNHSPCIRQSFPFLCWYILYLFAFIFCWSRGVLKFIITLISIWGQFQFFCPMQFAWKRIYCRDWIVYLLCICIEYILKSWLIH